MDYILFRGSNRCNFGLEDMDINKIGRVFKVDPSDIYLTSETNHTIFLVPASGMFPEHKLTGRLYEVRGTERGNESPQASADFQTPNRPTGQFAFRVNQPLLPVSTPARHVPQTAKEYVRKFFVGEVCAEGLIENGSFSIKYNNREADLPSMKQKVSNFVEDKFSMEDILIVDSKGSEIIDCDATKSFEYWRSPNRKFFVITESDREQLRVSKRRKLSRGSGSEDIQEQVKDGITEVLEAAKEQVQSWQRDVVGARLLLDLPKTNDLKASLECVICKDLVRQPVIDIACQCIIGCLLCIDETVRLSLDDPPRCPKCRQTLNRMELRGVSFEALRPLFTSTTTN